MAWARHGHGVASVNQTRPHCVNQMGKSHSKPLAARHGRGRAWARREHGMLCGSAFSLPCYSVKEHDGRSNTFLPSGLKAELYIYIYTVYIVCNAAITDMATVRKFDETDKFSVTESVRSKKFCTGIQWQR